MRFKYFKDKDSGRSVAINSDLVKYIIDSSYGPMIGFIDSSVLTIDGNYFDVVAELSAE